MTQTLSEMQMGCIQEYAQNTGRTVEECVAEAFDDWIRNVASTAVQDVSQFEKHSKIIMFPMPQNSYIH